MTQDAMARFEELVQRGQELLERYETHGDEENLRRAVELLQQALAETDNDAGRAIAASRLAIADAYAALHDLERCARTAPPELTERLDKAIGGLIEAERNMPPEDGLRLVVRFLNAFLQSVKFLWYGESEGEVDSVVAALHEVLELSKDGTIVANSAHLFLSIFSFLDSLSERGIQEFVAIFRRGGDGLPADFLESLLSLLKRSPAETGRAILAHLDKIEGPSPLDPQGELLSMMQKFAAVLTGRGKMMSDPIAQALLEVKDADVFVSLERALTVLSDEQEGRAELLSRFGLSLVNVSRPGEQLDRLRKLISEKTKRPCVDLENAAAERFLQGAVDALMTLHDPDSGRLESAVERIVQAADMVPAGHVIRVCILWSLAILLERYYSQRGGIEYLEAVQRYAEMAREESRIAGAKVDDLQIPIDVMGVGLPLGRISKQPNSKLAEGVLKHADQVLERFLDKENSQRKSQSYLYEKLRKDVEFLEFISGNPLEAGKEVPDAGFLAGVAKLFDGFKKRDLGLLDAGLSLLEGEEWDNRLGGLWVDSRLLRMMARHLRYRVSGDRADLDAVILHGEQLLRESEESAYGAHFKATILFLLALAYRNRDDQNLDDRARAVEIAAATLRERAADVLLQGSVEHAWESARDAAGEATLFARWCVDARRLEQAVQMLETGRAMVLHAATAETGIPGLLRRAGRPDLAEEWERVRGAVSSSPASFIFPSSLVGSGAAPGGGLHAGSWDAPLPGDLRYRVMQALEGTEAEQRLFAPPDVRRIGETLRTCGATALIYLLPWDKGSPGLAVVVEPDGRVRTLPLFQLTVAPNDPVADFAAALRERERAEPDTPEWEHACHRWRSALATLCEWAWQAAMEEVLAAVGADPTHRPRLVLVPVGELGLVPWHAARRKVADGRWRYVCQDAIVSYAASARQFLEAHSRPPRDPRSEPVLVRAPGGLVWASKEIRDLHARHYPHGLLLGDRRASPVTPAEVLAHLPRQGSNGASLLHLGCHARTAERPVDSHLQLARGRRLAMADVLQQARDRPRDGAGGLVVLAACASDLTGRDHDEALTLATAFLAAGATGVVGTRWPVDDLPTALFMTMFHYYLNAGYPDPAVALRAAQLWMLDPGRSLPVATDMAEEMSRIDLSAVEHWAAFTYQGR